MIHEDTGRASLLFPLPPRFAAGRNIHGRTTPSGHNGAVFEGGAGGAAGRCDGSSHRQVQHSGGAGAAEQQQYRCRGSSFLCFVYFSFVYLCLVAGVVLQYLYPQWVGKPVATESVSYRVSQQHGHLKVLSKRSEFFFCVKPTHTHTRHAHTLPGIIHIVTVNSFGVACVCVVFTHRTDPCSVPYFVLRSSCY